MYLTLVCTSIYHARYVPVYTSSRYVLVCTWHWYVPVYTMQGMYQYIPVLGMYWYVPDIGMYQCIPPHVQHPLHEPLNLSSLSVDVVPWHRVSNGVVAVPSILLLPHLSIPSLSLSLMSEPLTLLSSTLETVHLTCLHLCSLLQSTGYVLSLFPCLFQFSILPLTCPSLYSLPTAYTSSITQIILFNTLSFYLKQTTHFIVHRFFTHTLSSPTLW